MNEQSSRLYLLAILGMMAGSLPLDASEIEFNRDIRPILSNNCFSCHGPDADHREADLRLDDEAAAKADLGGYRVIAEGDPDNSELIARITSDDTDTMMPPPDAGAGKRLSADQVERLSRWIQQGAPWSKHWAYVNPVRHATPQFNEAQLNGPQTGEPDAGALEPADNWIDAYVRSQLERRGMQPSQEADPITLVRRLSFDLVGLPPSVALINEFAVTIGNDNANASRYQELVDRLLASAHFGERMAIYWLDLVRYADTVGYHGDQDHNISPYRDYVIDAFNRNLPFDQFTREQLAGDLLQDPTEDQMVATGYNRLLQTSHEGGLQPKEYLAIYAADRVRNVSMVWLGGTLGCAQCHDHKYDPYTAEDFYAMSAFFADIDDAQHFKVGTNALPTSRPPEIAVLNRRDRLRTEQLKNRVQTLKELRTAATAEGQAKIDAELAEVNAQLQSFAVNKRMTMVTVALEQPRQTRLLPRGNWLDESGRIVQPDVPSFLGSIAQPGRRATRLDLANWVTDPHKGNGLLTARVFVNRIWHLFFGEGLARNLADFGGQGEPPDHPQLLDRLAVEFVDHDWNIKWLVNQIVTSQTYKQTSRHRERNPGIVQRALTEANGGRTNDLQDDLTNRWLARQTSMRLPAEMIRDSALAISGLLVDDIGGYSVRPYQPKGYYRHLNFPQREYQHDDDRQQWRRGVYVHWQRQFLHPTLRALDAPSREECTAKRAQSNTPLAALALLNDPTFVEAARVFAQRVLLEAGDDTFETRLDYAFHLAVSRPPDEIEARWLSAYFSAELQTFQLNPADADQLIRVGQAAVPTRLDAVELAAWTSITRSILNLHETITRN